jgi:diguanylate cyclase (GGDEF)-like protein/PAS domain S-box-containing protein
MYPRMAGAPRLSAPGGPEVLAARWRAFVDESPLGIFEVDAGGMCTFVNPAFTRVTGFDAATAAGAGWRAAFRDEIEVEVGASARTLQVITADGELRWASLRFVPLQDAFLGMLEDVTEQRRLEERLEYDATHDRLTGLASRALLVEDLRAALARARRSNAVVAVLFVDLDGFKRVNDMLGHAAGDEVLVQVAQRLRNTVREGDVCVRLGGDEFVVCCADVGAARNAVVVAERLVARLGAPYDVHGHEVFVGASIGIATAHGEDPVSVDQMLANADVATYRAKHLGRGRAEVFDEDLRRQLAQERRFARTVGRMLDAPRLPILCAPIAELEHGTIVGFECAVDWKQAGLRESGAINQEIDDAGLSRALDIAMIRTILWYLADWEAQPFAPIVPGLSVVLTREGATSPILPELVRDMLARSHVNPSLCWIGIPEAAVAQQFDATNLVAQALDELHVGVALCDFGSAVSSLEQLRCLPTPTMTIAGPLVEDGDEVRHALLAAIVGYARALGRIVLASGVQDAEHAARLRALGCAFGTGPAFGPVLRPEDIPSFMHDRGAPVT